uniref:Uncharacterized protein n=1 Tax=Anguilla anguilla TaxID=7936 RepID=A0A0E9XP23_ANGAN
MYIIALNELRPQQYGQRKDIYSAVIRLFCLRWKRRPLFQRSKTKRQVDKLLEQRMRCINDVIRPRWSARQSSRPIRTPRQHTIVWSRGKTRSNQLHSLPSLFHPPLSPLPLHGVLHV